MEEDDFNPRYYPETELRGASTDYETWNVECDYCPRLAITLADGMKVCADHLVEFKPVE